MELNEEVLNIMSGIQKECHEFCNNYISKVKGATSQDITNVYLFHKLAEFEYRLRKLEEKNSRN
jgi:hypothetical protein